MSMNKRGYYMMLNRLNPTIEDLEKLTFKFNVLLERKKLVSKEDIRSICDRAKDRKYPGNSFVAIYRFCGNISKTPCTLQEIYNPAHELKKTRFLLRKKSGKFFTLLLKTYGRDWILAYGN